MLRESVLVKFGWYSNDLWKNDKSSNAAKLSHVHAIDFVFSKNEKYVNFWLFAIK